MDELPPRAKDVLRLARELDEHRDDEARQRVRDGVSKAVRGTAHDHGLAATAGKSVIGLSFPAVGAKLAATAALLGVLGAGLMWKSGEPVSHSAPLAVNRASRAVANGIQADTHAVLPSRGAETPPAPHARVETTPSSSARRPIAVLQRGDTLDREIALLHSVETALAHRDTRRAKVLLDQHRARFSQPALLEEREGFRALVRCIDGAQDAALAARQFLQRFPQSVLASRVQGECAVEEQRR